MQKAMLPKLGADSEGSDSRSGMDGSEVPGVLTAQVPLPLPTAVDEGPAAELDEGADEREPATIEAEKSVKDAAARRSDPE
jgi:hypothetical protein